MRAFKEKEAQRTPLEHEYERLQSILNGSSNARVKVSKTLYAGVIVNITDVSLIVKDDRSFCQLYKDEGEVKSQTCNEVWLRQAGGAWICRFVR